jgi:hypothetical protein
MDCTVCGRVIPAGGTAYELSKGTWDGEEFIHEESKGLYHEACIPVDLPVE